MTDLTDGTPPYADAIQAPGTDEGVWETWPGWESLPEFTLPPPGRVVVVAAHPDDEVLGLGGTIARLAAAGHGLTVVSVTDGEGSHPHSRVLRPHDLSRVRAEEIRTALDRLGAPDAEIARLHVPDSGVGRHEEEVRRALVPLCSGAALVAAPWTADVHSDHEAAGRAARAAAAESGVPFVEYPVWLWHWGRPEDPRVPLGPGRTAPPVRGGPGPETARRRCLRLADPAPGPRAGGSGRPASRGARPPPATP
ncbi:GlcNAc-PI de-N-acetylase [Streptomyces sp. DpondAA-F4]|nr:GlcNAc-PI de-N-acetylase [Streptomyces sp. DpondAA-F4]